MTIVLDKSGARHRNGNNRSNRIGSYWGPPGSWVFDRSAADTVPSIDPGSVAGPAANHALADSPAAESAVSTRREPGYSWTFCLQQQGTADRCPIPGQGWWAASRRSSW